MALNFPTSPVLNDEYTEGGVTWRYNGEAWIIIPSQEVQYADATITDLEVTSSATLRNPQFLGTITGLDINDMSDVSVSNPTDSDFLQYNASTQSWSPAPAQAAGQFTGGTISNPLFINNTTSTTNVNTGALRVGGGVGIVDDMFIGGSINLQGEQINVNTGGSIRWYNSGDSGYIGFVAPSNASSITFTLPAGDGSSGQFLRTNGSGQLSWASAAGASGGTPPGGVNTQVQFNDNNDFQGSTAFTFNATDLLVTIPDLTTTGWITVEDTSEATDVNTGSIQTSGGVGIEKQLHVGGATNTFTGGTSSTSINTGTIIVTGGMGISEKVHVGSTVSSDAAPTEADHLTNKKYVDANVLAFSVAFGA
jgi:hypothetical protein